MAGSVRRRRSRVDEVGSGLDASHGPGGAVVGARRLLRRVEGAEPLPLLGQRVSDLGGVTAPRTPPDASIPHRITWGASVFEGPLVGGGARLVWGELDRVGLRRVGQPV